MQGMLLPGVQQWGKHHRAVDLGRVDCPASLGALWYVLPEHRMHRCTLYIASSASARRTAGQEQQGGQQGSGRGSQGACLHRQCSTTMRQASSQRQGLSQVQCARSGGWCEIFTTSAAGHFVL